MSLTLTVTAITPPKGLAHTDRQTEILELPNYLRVTGATGADALKMIYVGTTAPGPSNIDNIWLKTDEAGTAHGFYRYDTTLGIWLLMAGPGVICGTTVPTDTNVLWLKTDAVAAILTPGGSAVAAPMGLYQFNGTLWVCITATPAVTEVYVQATAPTGVTGAAWLKTADEKGVWYWDGSAWVNAAAMSALGAIGGLGTGCNYAQVSSVAPIAAIRPYSLWAKTGNEPCGLFWPDVANNRWESIHPITIAYIDYAGTLASGVLYDTGALAFSVLCPTIGTAVFAAAPLMHVSLTDDDQFASGGYLNIGASSTLTTFTLNAFHASGSDRHVKINVTATGIMRIPF